MKRIVLLIAFVAAVALCAGAQTYIDFHQMPVAKTPSPMPDYYPDGMNLYWDHFFYVSPGLWSGEGPGFWVDPTTQHNTAVFVGGPTCPIAATCVGTIKVASQRSALSTFTPMRIQMSAGWVPNKVTITAYNNSKFIGTTTVQLTTRPHIFTLPNVWHQVTELVFAPEPIPSNSVVIYSFLLKTE
jgi:hypothetical protein